MSNIASMLSATLPHAWQTTHVIYLEPGWEVIGKDDEHVAVATGTTIEEALANLRDKISSYQFMGRLFSNIRFIEEQPRLPLAGLLNLGRKAPTDFKRRI